MRVTVSARGTRTQRWRPSVSLLQSRAASGLQLGAVRWFCGYPEFPSGAGVQSVVDEFGIAEADYHWNH